MEDKWGAAPQLQGARWKPVPSVVSKPWACGKEDPGEEERQSVTRALGSRGPTTVPYPTVSQTGAQ